MPGGAGSTFMATRLGGCCGSWSGSSPTALRPGETTGTRPSRHRARGPAGQADTPLDVLSRSVGPGTFADVRHTRARAASAAAPPCGQKSSAASHLVWRPACGRRRWPAAGRSRGVPYHTASRSAVPAAAAATAAEGDVPSLASRSRTSAAASISETCQWRASSRHEPRRERHPTFDGATTT